MADKKMTELDPLGTGIASEDLLHVVDSPDSSPVNKKVSVEDFMGNQNKTLSSTDSAGHEHIKSTVTVGTSTTTYSGDIAPFSTLVSATPSGDTTVTNVYGAKVVANAGISTLNTSATSVIAGAYIEADITNDVGSVASAFNASSRQYGLVIRVNDSEAATTPRAVKPNAMIQLKDDTATLQQAESDDGSSVAALQYTVSHLWDMANVHLSSNADSYSGGEGMILRSSNNEPADAIAENMHKVRVHVNGEDMFLLATSNAETQTAVAA